MERFRKIYFLLSNKKGELYFVVFLFVLSAGLDLLGIALIGPYVSLFMSSDSAVSGNISWLLGFADKTQLLYFFGGFLVLVYFIKGVVGYRVHKNIFKYSIGVQADIIRRLVYFYQHVQYEYHLLKNSSEMVNSVVNHSKIFANDFLIPFFKIIADSVILLGIGLFLVWVDPVYTLLMFVLFSGVFLYYYLDVRNDMRMYGKKGARAYEEIIKTLNESVSGYKEIKVLGKEAYFFRKVSDSSVKYADYISRYYSLQVLPRYLMETILVVAVVFTIMAAVLLGKSSDEVISKLALFGMAGIRVLPSVHQLASGVGSISYAGFSLQCLYEQLVSHNNYDIGNKAHVDSSALRVWKKSLVFEDIYFKYPGRSNYALSGATIELIKGGSVGIVGESGSGKTTLVNILVGLLSPLSGKIIIDNKEIDCQGWKKLTQEIFYLPQDVFVIDDDLKSNVALGECEIDEARVHSALEKANLASFIASLPKGLSTVMGERGAALSGGQKQRLALARAFYMQKSIVIMDEATSAMDVETEKAVVSSINDLKGKVTLVVIAHRLSTIKGCDCVYELKNGRVVKRDEFPEAVSLG